MQQHPVDFGVCHVPAQHFDWQEPDPTVASWLAAHAIGVSHVRMDYKLRDLQYFEPALRAALDGKMRVTANMGILFDRDGGDIDDTLPTTIEAAAYDLVLHYGNVLESISFENEPGGQLGMSPQSKVLDISQGGTFDWIKKVYGPLFLAFVRGARRANVDVVIDAFDADSTDVQERCMALAGGDPNYGPYRWCFHNYADVGGDPANGNPGGQDYSSMAGMNGKPGFLSVVNADPFKRDWYVSEIGKTTGPFGGIATDSDMQVMLAYTKMMLSKYPQCRKIDFGSAKFFFKRVPVWSARQPDLSQPDADTWCTWTHGDPVPSAMGLLIAAEFAKINGPVDPVVTTMPVPGRRPGQGRR